MSTRVGKYIFDIDLENMSIEKLEFLKSGCDCFIKQKLAEQFEREFTELNLRAHAEGFHLCYQDESMDTPAVLNRFTFHVVDRSVIDDD